MAYVDVILSRMSEPDPGMPFAGVAVGVGRACNLPANGRTPSSRPDAAVPDPGTARGAMA
jgi:hypothetical protein